MNSNHVQEVWILMMVSTPFGLCMVRIIKEASTNLFTKTTKMEINAETRTETATFDDNRIHFTVYSSPLCAILATKKTDAKNIQLVCGIKIFSTN